MNLADLSIKRPIFISCIVLLSLAAGLLSIAKLGVDLFPDVTFPVVTITTAYPGAGPAEVETLVSKPIEDEVSTLAGIKRLSSINNEGVSVVIAEFQLKADIKDSETQVRDRVSGLKRLLPTDIKEPIIRRIDPADQPVISLSVKADMGDAALYDFASEKVKPLLEQVDQVGSVKIYGGRKREIQVQLDRDKLKSRELSATMIAGRLAGAGQDIPSGKRSEGEKETVFRTVGEFKSLEDIRSMVVNFFGNDTPVRIADVGQVVDTLQDETTRAFVNGNKSLILAVYKQSGANTIAVVNQVKKQINKLNASFKTQEGHPEMTIIRDGSIWINANVQDVKESIMLGVVLAVFVVFLFLANGRSTIITGLALPNSLIGAFVLMAVAGFTINIMTLLALSLSVGLLIDDAIVVRENIFRHIEMGKKPIDAALEGTKEVSLAVVATTLTVIAVFGPLGFLSGVVGQFFKQFGLTVCFAMAISMFDALTIAPMLSAYFAGRTHDQEDKKGFWDTITGGPLLRAFSRFQDWLEVKYEATMRFTIKYPIIVITFSVFVFFVSLFVAGRFVPKTFLPAQDAGEFTVGMDLTPGTNLDKTTQIAQQIDAVIRKNPEVLVSSLQAGSEDGDANKADIYVHLIDAKKRKVNTSQFKDILRGQLKEFAFANPTVKDYDPVGAGQRPFNLNISGLEQDKIETYARLIADRAKKMPGLKDVDVSFRPGKPEFQVKPDKFKSQQLGVSTATIGTELRALVEGAIPAKYRENGLEYDIRVRLQENQRDLRKGFLQTFVPNLNMSLVRLSNVAAGVETSGPSTITRQDRIRYVQIAADITPGAGLGDIVSELTNVMTNEIKIPEGLQFSFVGQAENFAELVENMIIAMGAGILFIYFVLSSLYESFVTPFTIMLALPLAICGALVGLWIGHESINIFSMIGIVMLLGVATKNSILLVDYANQLTAQGKSREDAILIAGKTRLRPILMTTMALIAGTIPIALGLNEASRQRTSMGVAIIGGLVSSTALTLIVVPAAYSYIDRFRVWSSATLARIFTAK